MTFYLHMILDFISFYCVLSMNSERNRHFFLFFNKMKWVTFLMKFKVTMHHFQIESYFYLIL